MAETFFTVDDLLKNKEFEAALADIATRFGPQKGDGYVEKGLKMAKLGLNVNGTLAAKIATAQNDPDLTKATKEDGMGGLIKAAIDKGYIHIDHDLDADLATKQLEAINAHPGVDGLLTEKEIHDIVAAAVKAADERNNAKSTVAATTTTPPASEPSATATPTTTTPANSATPSASPAPTSSTTVSASPAADATKPQDALSQLADLQKQMLQQQAEQKKDEANKAIEAKIAAAKEAEAKKQEEEKDKEDKGNVKTIIGFIDMLCSALHMDGLKEQLEAMVKGVAIKGGDPYNISAMGMFSAAGEFMSGKSPTELAGAKTGNTAGRTGT